METRAKRKAKSSPEETPPPSPKSPKKKAKKAKNIHADRILLVQYESISGGSQKEKGVGVNSLLSLVLFKKTIKATKLDKDFPPKFKSRNKVLIYSLLDPIENDNSKVTISKYSKIPFDPEFVLTAATTQQIMRQDGYGYQKEEIFEATQPVMEWYVNFADYNLFGFYGGSLFAQDEMMVMEHPQLGSVREAMLKIANEGNTVASPHTRNKKYSQKINEPTPVIIKGVKRRVHVSVDSNPSEGRPYGLYLLFNLDCCDARPKCKVIVHTGNWGTGAYGGNKILMAFLQMMAAQLAGVDALIFHTFDKLSSDAYKNAKELVDLCFEDSESKLNVKTILETLFSKKFEWGVGDGN